MTEIEITLRKAPATWNVGLPRFSNPELNELSELAHGGFSAKTSVQIVRTGLVADYLKRTFDVASKRNVHDLSPEAFLHVASSLLYSARLKSAYNSALLDGRTEHLVGQYESLYNDLTARTRRILHEEGVDVPDTLPSLSNFRLKNKLEPFARSFFQNHGRALNQVTGNPPAEQEASLPNDIPDSLSEEALAKIKPAGKGKKKVFITIDDGPGPWSKTLLDRLKRLSEKLKMPTPVTLFFTGGNIDVVKDSDALIKRAVDEGHEVGAHGHFHEEQVLESSPTKDVLDREIRGPVNTIRELSGRAVKWFRFPGGRMSSIALNFLSLLGIRHVDWSLDTRDWHLAEQAAIARTKENPNADQITASFHDRLIASIQTARPGDVILLHESAPLKPMTRVFGMPILWKNEDMQEEDAKGRFLRATARGEFLVGNLENVFRVLNEKGLEPALLSNRKSDYSARYWARYGAKVIQAMPGGRMFFTAAQNATSAAKAWLSSLRPGNVKTRVRNAAYRVFLDKFPPGALTFHYWARLHGKITDDLKPEIESLRARLGLADLYVAHGFAVEKDGKAYVMSGPPGIGKSTLLDSMLKEPGAEALDDGFVLLGKTHEGQPVVVSTGAFEPKRARTKIEQRLRRFFRYESPFMETEDRPKDARTVQKLKRNEGIQTLIAQVLALRMPKFTTPFEPRVVPLARYALVHHADDPMYLMHVNTENKASRIEGKEKTIEQKKELFEEHFPQVGQVFKSGKGWADNVRDFFES